MVTAFRVPVSLLSFALFFGLASDTAIHAQESSAAESPTEVSKPADSAEAAGDTGLQESAEPSEPTTTADPLLPLDHLEILVRPLTKSELEVEAEAWKQLLREKAGEIATTSLQARQIKEELNGTAPTPEAADQAAEQAASDPPESSEPDGSTNEPTVIEPAATEQTAGGSDAESQAATRENLLARIIELQDERTALSDRLEVVLASLELKGGDVASYRNYVFAISGLELDTSDVSSVWAGVVGWLRSKEGGQRWAWNFARFLLILFITWVVARLIARVVNWLLERKVKLSQLAERMIARMIRNVLFAIGFAIALTALEIDITPLVAAIGATGLVVGLALQGTLSNFASGLLILINRPFDVGDVVSAGGVTGTIDQMNLVSTRFKTFDNQEIYVPNNEIWNNVITNITANETRRVDLEFGVGYDDDFEEAERIILDIVSSHELVLDDPEPMVVTHALADSSVKIVCRPWAKTSDWWTVNTDVTRAVKKRFDQAGISIPYPQTDVHVHQVKPAGNPD